jgi:hypothetical protein
LLGFSEEAGAPPVEADVFKSSKYSSFKRTPATVNRKPGAYGTSVDSVSGAVFSTSMLQSAMRALNAPMAAATGAITAPMTPAVSGNSATV